MLINFKMSLKDKLFLNTRPVQQAPSLSRLLKEHGANVIEFSCLEISPNNLTTRQISEIEAAECLVFTSSGAVKIINDKNLILKNHFIACIGEQTKKFAENSGHLVDFIPEKADSQSFAKELAKYLRKNTEIESIALLRAKKADPILKEILLDAGYQIADIAIYDTTFPSHEEFCENELLEKLELISMPIFTSSETVNNFVNFLRVKNVSPEKIEHFRKLTSASIGVKTEETLKKQGFTQVITPQKACVESLVSEIVAHYEQDEKQIS